MRKKRHAAPRTTLANPRTKKTNWRRGLFRLGLAAAIISAIFAAARTDVLGRANALWTGAAPSEHDLADREAAEAAKAHCYTTQPQSKAFDESLDALVACQVNDLKREPLPQFTQASASANLWVFALAALGLPFLIALVFAWVSRGFIARKK
jgi:hypothetical protein